MKLNLSICQNFKTFLSKNFGIKLKIKRKLLNISQISLKMTILNIEIFGMLKSFL